MSERWMRLGVLYSVMAVAGLALACGGGGGGGGGTAATLELTENNDEQVVKAVAGGTGALITSSQEAPVNKPGEAAANGSGLANLTTDIILYATSESTVNYPGGGTATVTLNDADDSSSISAGDSITAVYDNAVRDTTTVNGTLTLTVVSLAANQALQYVTFTASVTVTDLVVTQDGEAREMDGGYNVSVTIDGIANSVTGHIYGSSLTVVEDGVEWTLSTFVITYWTNTQTTNYNYASSGALTSDDVGGTVVFSTPTIFQGTGDGYPSTGEMLIVGAGSTLTLMAQDSTSVQIDLDSDGDGTVDHITITTWELLLEDDGGGA